MADSSYGKPIRCQNNSHIRCNSHYTQTEACGIADSHIDNVIALRYWLRYTQSLSSFKNTLEDSISLSVKLITQARKGRTTMPVSGTERLRFWDITIKAYPRSALVLVYKKVHNAYMWLGVNVGLS